MGVEQAQNGNERICWHKQPRQFIFQAKSVKWTVESWKGGIKSAPPKCFLFSLFFQCGMCVIVLVLAFTVSIWCIDACGHLTSHWMPPSSFGGNCPFHLQLIRHCSWYSSYAAWPPKQCTQKTKKKNCLFVEYMPRQSAGRYFGCYNAE